MNSEAYQLGGVVDLIGFSSSAYCFSSCELLCPELSRRGESAEQWTAHGRLLVFSCVRKYDLGGLIYTFGIVGFGGVYLGGKLDRCYSDGVDV